MPLKVFYSNQFNFFIDLIILLTNQVGLLARVVPTTILPAPRLPCGRVCLFQLAGFYLSLDTAWVDGT